ncbi:MAG: hypothetical protein QNJ77_14650 [Acidimicrobiia bacterium]|nr:hypothetical protein [Acidimicrobiia bacterium]
MSRKRTLFALLAAMVLATAIPVTAGAQTESEVPRRDDPAISDAALHDNFERARAHIVDQIERRLGALDRLVAKVESAQHMTETHAAALQEDVAAAREVLRAGLAAVQAVTTLEELREIAPPIFETTLVFALLAPKTHEVAASDTVVAASDRFTEFGSELQEALDRIARETDVDTSEAQEKLDEMLRLVEQAVATGGPVAEDVVGLQPEDWPDPAQAALREGKAALDESREALREAHELAHQVVEFIRSAVGPLDASS